IQAVVPPSARTGNVTVQVFNAGQATSPMAFTVLAELKIASFNPLMGPPGTTVTLKGSGFSTTKKDNTVRLGDQVCKILSATPNELVVSVPSKNAKSARFSVEVKGLGTFESPNYFPVVYPPQITGFSPPAGNVGTEVTVEGLHLAANPPATQVLLTGRACEIISVQDAAIRVRVPQGAVSGPIKVVIAQMGEGESKGAFEVWAPLAVTRMEPPAGLPQTEVRLWGTGFRTNPGDHTLYMADKPVPIERIDQGALVFKVPADAPDGPVMLRLDVKDRGGTMIAMPLQILHTPVIDGFKPERGPVGTAVEISGKYFGSQLNYVRVLLGGQIVPLSSVNPNSIVFSVPPGAVSGKIEVQTPRRGNVAATKPFDVYVPVTVSGFLPTMGIENEIVHIFGSGFETVAKNNIVTMNGVKLQVIEATQTQLKVKLNGKVATGSLRVEVPNRGFMESIQKFTILTKLEVRDFEPKKGVPGSLVTIKGKGFENKDLRGYIGSTPIGVRVDSPTQVTIGVAPGAETGPFVFVAPGAGRSESREKFKILVPLVISGFQPAYGPAGTKVSVYGTGFDLKPNKTKIFYGQQQLNIEPGSSETMLIVTIPKGAEDAPFKVRLKDRGDIESENVFSVVKPVAAPMPVQPAVAAAGPGAMPQPVPGAKPSGPPPSMDDMLGMPGRGATQPATQPAAQPVAQPGAQPAAQPVAVQAKPAVTGFDPLSAPVGEVVTINGSNFGEDQSAVKAWVGQVPAAVVGVVPDMIMIEVPAGVKRGKIRVKVGGLPQVESKDLFEVSQ
ncbi:MAG: IPT/TIG domain-containing protein, partial [Deltaproteobacteria bacterium]|nr:IPT/TIG domain-containing protein [Deltaproteobacteria bacterium]